MRKIYFDLVCGASGDMILSCLLDLGIPVDYLNEQIKRLGLDGVALSVERTSRNGIACSKVSISAEPSTGYRHLPQIMEIIRRAGYSDAITSRCEGVLTRLAQAEARVHGIPVERVHFHEIGAVDTIVDVVGACLGIDYLKADEVGFSDLTTGRGTIASEHGILPVPAPATAEMLKGFTVRALDIEEEALTPTGCAVLTSLGRQTRTLPLGTVAAVGYGCGDKVFAGWPNILRAFLVEENPSGAARDRVCLIESDMDHLSGEVMAFVAERVMAAGALDVSWSPVLMKKGRPGYRLSVICTEEKRDELADIVLIESRTLGVRCLVVDRIVAQRSSSTDHLLGTEVASKNCSYKGHSFTKPEFDALAMMARERQRPLLELAEEYIRLRGA